MISRSLLGVAILAIATAPIAAAPLKYEVSMTVPDDFPLSLRGGALTLDFQWDSAPLTPEFDRPFVSPWNWMTAWPTSNTTARVTITGSGPDEEISPVLLSGDWELTNGNPVVGIGDGLRFPGGLFPYEGRYVVISNFQAIFADYYYGQPTITPKPFTTSEVEWGPLFIGLNNSTESWLATGVSGTAVPVPEPTAFALALTMVAAVTFRRK